MKNFATFSYFQGTKWPFKTSNICKDNFGRKLSWKKQGRRISNMEKSEGKIICTKKLTKELLNMQKKATCH